MEGQGIVKENEIGIYYYANKEKYDGQWSNNSKNGKGKETVLNVGIYNYYNGDKYDGMWKDGKRHGRGSSFSYSRNSILC